MVKIQALFIILWLIMNLCGSKRAMYFSVRGFGCALFIIKGDIKMEETIALVIAVIMIIAIVALVVASSKKEKKQQENNQNFLNECKEKGISLDHPEEATEIMGKYGIDSGTAKSLFAREKETQIPDNQGDSLAENISLFAWLIGIIGIIFSIIVGLFSNDGALCITFLIASAVFILLLLGLARIINYLCKINFNTQKIADALEKQNKE